MTADLVAAHDEIRRYVDSIRNANKRIYAEHYYQQTIRNGLPVSSGSLSTMAAQAVRLRIAAILNAPAPERRVAERRQDWRRAGDRFPRSVAFAETDVSDLERES